MLAKKDLRGLVEALGDEDPQIVWQAASALGNLRDPQVGDLLLEALKKPALRCGAIRALGCTGNMRYLEPLIAALHDNDFSVRHTAAFALSILPDPRVAEPLATALNDANDLVRCQAATGLAMLKDPRGSDCLVELLKESHWGARDMDVIGLAIDALVKFGGSPAVKPLLAAIYDKDSFVRGAAAEVLGKIKDPSAIEPLRAALKDPRQDVRISVANALEAITGERHFVLEFPKSS
jgi:HEAT repeat protein